MANDSASGSRKRRRKRGVKRKRAHTAAYSLLLTLVMLAVVVVSVTLFFKITDVYVSGETRYGTENLVKTSGIETGENMFLIDKFGAIRALLDEYPYLDEIRIKRKLPGSVEIAVTECVPAACIRDGQGLWLVDLNGKLLERTVEDAPAADGLARIAGVGLSEPSAGKIFKTQDEDKHKPVLEILHTAKIDDILKNIDEIDVDKLFDITLRYKGRFTVFLGTIENLSRKLKLLESAEQQKLGPEDKGVLNITDAKTVRFIPEE